jgi:hypothetical protein
VHKNARELAPEVLVPEHNALRKRCHWPKKAFADSV